MRNMQGVIIGCVYLISSFVVNTAQAMEPATKITVVTKSVVTWKLWKGDLIACFDDGTVSVYSGLRR